MGTLKYQVIGRKRTFGKNAGKTTYTAQAVGIGTISFNDFCRELSDGSTVDTADVKAVLSRMATVIPRLLERGFSVDCGELGKFRASFGSKEAESAEAFRAEMIRPARVVFTPRKDFKNALRSVGFERVGATSGSTEAKPTTGGGESEL